MGIGKKLARDIKYNKYVYIIALPVIVYYIVFRYVPIYGLVIAFKDYVPSKGVLGSDWVGLKHFISFFNNFQSWRIIKNTVLLGVYDILWGFPVPILLALLLNEVRGKYYKRVVQTVSYLPHFISLVVICGLIIDFTSSDGVINDVLSVFGIPRSSFMMRPELFRTLYISSGIWQSAGWGSIIYLAAIAGIDSSLYEAAIIDGAGRFRQLLRITVPCIMPTITILLILRLGQIMTVGWEKIILLYNPTIYQTADVISSFVYRRGLQEFDYSFSAAVGLFNSVINFIFLVSANRFSRKFSESSLW